jgi:general secretion pathway protein K
MNRRGLALVTVLWVLTLLSLIAASFSSSTRTEVKLAFNQTEAARAEALADAGLHTAILGLLIRDPQLQWRVDGTVYGWEFGAGEIRVNVWDEGAKIDLNAAPDALLQSLFVVLGETPGNAAALVDRIVDYRDPNDLRQLNGAEDRDYADAGLPYGAKDAPFEVLEELRQILGMTPALFDAAAPALTVQARQRTPHEPTASPLVKAALLGAGPIGPSEGAVDGGLAEIGDGTVPVAPVAPPSLGAGAVEADLLGPERSRINIFTIHSEARTASGAIYVREAVIELGTAGELPYEFWAWKQGKRTLFPVAKAEE